MAWPGWPPECQWARTGWSRAPDRCTPLDPSIALSVLARARKLFLLRSADALGWLGRLRAVAMAAPLEGVWGPSILKQRWGGGGPPLIFRVGIWWASRCFPGSSQPPVCFPIERGNTFLSTLPRSWPELPSDPGSVCSVGRGLGELGMTLPYGGPTSKRESGWGA